MADSTRVAIGIDLGTTFSCVGVYQNDKVEIIANDQGNRITPSYVAFTDEERLIGEAAKEQIASNPKNTVYDAKRLLGRKFDDSSIRQDRKLWPFTLVDVEGKPTIEVEYLEETKQFTPEEISSMVLTKMKEVAETYIGCNVMDAVITVPAYFNDSQRQATKDAGIIAGFNVMCIINEPTAAAIAYGLNKDTREKKNILIFDLGGGTFDVVILSIENGMFDVLAVGGDTHLGGQDFDNRLVEYFAREFRRKHKKDITGNVRAEQRLKDACEKTKRSLSSSARANIDVDCLLDGIDFHSSITRVRFEELCNDLFQHTLAPVESALKDAQMEKDDLDEIVLVGGSTRIIKIQKLLEEFFNGRKMNMSINPDEAVAYGAAVQAAVLTGAIPDEKVVLLDVAPLSLGIETAGGYMNTIIKRNTKVPTKCTKKDFTTFLDNQKNMQIQAFEGEHQLTKDNHLLGTFILSNIQQAARGVPSIDVTFEIDSNGILSVSAEDRATKCQGGISIAFNKGRLGKEDIKRMIEASAKFKEDDNKQKEINAARSSLESYCFKAKEEVRDPKSAGKITADQIKVVVEACDEALDWLDDNQTTSKQECEQQMTNLKGKCSSIIDKLKSEPSFFD